MIGSPFDTPWADQTGPYFTGLGSGELTWLVVSILLCLAALVMGARHEHGAYQRVKK
jgi:hypothetical protein